MPAPIVPVNNRLDPMRPREVASTQRGINQFPAEHRLNIYGIEARKKESVIPGKCFITSNFKLYSAKLTIIILLPNLTIYS
jgi:hypothetical protein